MPESQPVLTTTPLIGSTERGFLSFLQGAEIPFPIARVYWIASVPENVWRGGHAHLTTWQLVFCPTACRVHLSLENVRGEIQHFELTHGNVLTIPPCHWIRFRLTPGAALVVLASTEYTPDDSLYDYQLFRQFDPAASNATPATAIWTSENSS